MFILVSLKYGKVLLIRSYNLDIFN